MEQAQDRFHVLAQGRQLGPYDRRTIVGMCIRQVLGSSDELLDAAGQRLTVAELLGQRPAAAFDPQRTGSYSVVRATYTAALLAVDGAGLPIPAFRGEIEARLQIDVLRLAERFRRWGRWGPWREDRVKLPLQDIVHAGCQGSQVTLALRPGSGQPLQLLHLELFVPDSAAALVRQLPAATALPAGLAPPGTAARARLDTPALWMAVAAGSFVLAVGVAVLLLL